MPLPPIPVQDPFAATSKYTDALRNVLPPATSGVASRQSAIPNNKPAFYKRNMLRWLVPETGIVDMYINPQSITYKDGKVISSERSKGGFILQYYGEEFTEISLNGHTGSSGIEGINVLYDVYRSEQVAFDPYALLISQVIEDQRSNLQLGRNDAGEFFSDVGGTVLNAFADGLQTATTGPTRPTPTLASLAFSVEMYWQGWVYRGFFRDFTLTESADKLGLYDYSISFSAFQKRGYRYNTMPWHRSATSGPSNSDPQFGVPYSFGALTSEPAPQQAQRETVSLFATVNDQLKSAGGFIEDIF